MQDCSNDVRAVKKAQEKKLDVAEMRMLRSHKAGQKKEWKNQRDNKTGINIQKVQERRLKRK